MNSTQDNFFKVYLYCVIIIDAKYQMILKYAVSILIKFSTLMRQKIIMSH